MDWFLRDSAEWASAMTRPVCQAAIDLIKKYEVLALKAYYCPAGVLTIGYGHTYAVTPALRITEAQAEQWLRDDLESTAKYIEQRVTVPLTDNQFGALVALVFNIGKAAFGHSTLLKLLSAGRYDAAAQQFERWVYANGKVLDGLVKRRKAERKLFLTKGG